MSDGRFGSRHSDAALLPVAPLACRNLLRSPCRRPLPGFFQSLLQARAFGRLHPRERSTLGGPGFLDYLSAVLLNFKKVFSLLADVQAGIESIEPRKVLRPTLGKNG